MPSSNSPAPPMPDGAADVARPPSDSSVSSSRRKLAREPSGGAGLKKAKTYSELQGAFFCPPIYPPSRLPRRFSSGIGWRGRRVSLRTRACVILGLRNHFSRGRGGMVLGFLADEGLW